MSHDVNLYCGIDYSLSTPALCFQSESLKFQDSQFHFLTKVKKHHGNPWLPNVTGYPTITEWSCEEQRYDFITTWVIRRIEEFECQFARYTRNLHVYVEDYSYGSKGNVYEIGENTGIMKYMLYKRDIIVQKMAPKEIKKGFCGKGNAKKYHMNEALLKQSGLDLWKIMSPQKKDCDSPNADVVDAFATCVVGRQKFQG